MWKSSKAYEVKTAKYVIFINLFCLFGFAYTMSQLNSQIQAIASFEVGERKIMLGVEQAQGR